MQGEQLPCQQLHILHIFLSRIMKNLKAGPLITWISLLLTNGLNFITRIGIENITHRIKELSHLILSELAKLKHNNGRPS